MRLRPDGSISGYNNANERRWDISGGCLNFYSDSGKLSTTFTESRSVGDTIQLSGPFLLQDLGIILCLESIREEEEEIAPSQTSESLRHWGQLRGWTIGDYTYGTPDIIEAHLGHLSIGRFCSIAMQVTIILGDHNYRMATTYPFVALCRDWAFPTAGTDDHISRGNIIIGNDVWIGKGAYIMCSQIGDGAVVGANAVVTRDVPPYAIVGGNPARVIAYRFPSETVERLLLLRWWDWPKHKIETMLPLMMSENIQAFLIAGEALNS